MFTKDGTKFVLAYEKSLVLKPVDQANQHIAMYM